MKLNHLRWQVIRPALKLLEDVSGKPLMGDHRAEVMLIAIALQESAASFRWQVHGPARSYWQFEKNGAFRGILNHPGPVKGYSHALLTELDLPDSVDEAWAAMPYSELFQAGMARLLLWTHPQPLPAAMASNVDVAWQYYLHLWRPGKPHPDRWPANWQQALKLCSDF